MGHRFHLWVVGVVVAGLLCCGPRLLCQVQVGDNILLNLDGSVAAPTREVMGAEILPTTVLALGETEI